MVCHSFTIKPKKIYHTILEISTKKNSVRNLTRFYCGLFELEILGIFQTLQIAFLKNETKTFSKKMQVNQKLLDS